MSTKRAKQHKCTECDLNCTNAYSLKVHMRTHTRIDCAAPEAHSPTAPCVNRDNVMGSAPRDIRGLPSEIHYSTPGSAAPAHTPGSDSQGLARVHLA